MTAEELTPYDILPPPVAAYAPSALVWIVFFSILLLVLLCLRFLKARGQRRDGKLEAARRAFFELQGVIAQDKITAQGQLSSSSLITRRMLSSILGEPLDTLSSRELRVRGKAFADTNVENVIDRLLAIEELRFQPKISETPTRPLLVLLSDAIDTLASAVQYRDAKIGRKEGV